MKWQTTFSPLSSLILMGLALVARGVQSVGTSLELQCPSCEQIHCTPRKARRLRCKGGVTRGVCNCCPVCAKTEGEHCGGAHNYLGKCDRGLYCKPDHNQVIAGMEFDAQTFGKKAGVHIPEGMCKTAPSTYATSVHDQPASAFCKQKCTPKFCRHRPRAICSAIDNSERPRPCQGQCQHTSCRACRFVDADLGCDKCPHDDFRCMRNFGRCIKRNYCTRQKFPCKLHSTKFPGSKFQCIVPQCLDEGR